MQTKTPKYLVFISHEKGGHTNIIVDSVSEAWWAIQGILDEEEFKSIDSELEASIDALADGEDMWREFKDGTWTTITRHDIEKPIFKTIGVDGRELNAVLIGLRQLQKHGYIKEYLDEEMPLDNDEIDELCDMLNVVEPIKKQVVLPRSLVDRIRGMAEANAIATYTCDSEAVPYGEFMAAEDVHEIASIWEPFQHDNTEEIKENVENEADSLVGFADAIINTMSVEDMMDIIAQRAVDAGAVDTKSELALLALKSMGASEKDALNGGIGHYISDTDEVFVYIEGLDDESLEEEVEDLYDQLQKASEFGISYVNGY